MREKALANPRNDSPMGCIVLDWGLHVQILKLQLQCQENLPRIKGEATVDFKKSLHMLHSRWTGGIFRSPPLRRRDFATPQTKSFLHHLLGPEVYRRDTVLVYSVEKTEMAAAGGGDPWLREHMGEGLRAGLASTALEQGDRSRHRHHQHLPLAQLLPG